MKQQTAVQWLLERVPEFADKSIPEMALMIERYQIDMAYGNGLLQFARKPEEIEITEYYERTHQQSKGTN
jgi:hypothetical protein